MFHKDIRENPCNPCPNKNAFIPQNGERRHSTSPTENGSGDRPHPSLCGEVGRIASTDERSQTGILTSASNLIPPSRWNSGIGICSRYSGATVPDSHRVPWTFDRVSVAEIFRRFKERRRDTPKSKSCQVIIKKIHC
jgi:hypothetical protein